MPLSVWTEKSGFSFGRFEERLNFNQTLPVENDFEVTYSIIAWTIVTGKQIGRAHV